MRDFNSYQQENSVRDANASPRNSWDEVVGTVAQIVLGLVLGGVAIALSLAVAYLVISPALP
jgi:hypothetical protein